MECDYWTKPKKEKDDTGAPFIVIRELGKAVTISCYLM